MEHEDGGYVEELFEDSDEHRHYYSEAKWAFDFLMNLVQDDSWSSKSGYKLEKQSADTTDVVHSIQKDGLGKIFCLTADVEYDSLKNLFDELYYNLESTPSWNPDVAEYRKIIDVGKQSDVVYSVSNDILGGLVKSRDFVDARCWRNVGDTYCIAQRFVETPLMPPQKGRVRAANMASLVRLSPTEKERVYKFEWLARLALKGFLPQALTDRSMHYFMMNYIKTLRSHLKDKLERSTVSGKSANEISS